MLVLSNIKISVTKTPTEEELRQKAAKVLRIKPSLLKNFGIEKKSIDARDKNDVHYVFSVHFDIDNEEKYIRKNVSRRKEYSFILPKAQSTLPPIVVGFGPGGMLAALMLAKGGLKPIVIERGKAVDKRQADIELFHKTGVLNTSSNVQFGEGGAGTFSDGKLNSGKHDPLIRTVFEELVAAGAPKEIMYMAKPHIGTDNLVSIVRNIRGQVKALGGQVLFEHRLTDLNIESGKICGIEVETPEGKKNIPCSRLILAPGHSARDTFEMLLSKNIQMEQKPFAMGVRIEHNQQDIDTIQYGRFAKYLPAADYKLAVHLENGRGIYTFCMCPGGYVTAAASEEGGLVTNGMSYYARDGKNSNAALLVGLTPDDFENDHPLAGVKLQRELERKAFVAGGSNYFAPVQLVGDLLKDVPSTQIGSIEPTYKPGITPSDMKNIFPDFMYQSLKEGIIRLDKQLKGFSSPHAVLTAVESRSSSPVRIVRNNQGLESVSVKGLYPCGEGCGYAGGIVSAAVDGIKCAFAVCESLQ